MVASNEYSVGPDAWPATLEKNCCQYEYLHLVEQSFSISHISAGKVIPNSFELCL